MCDSIVVSIPRCHRGDRGSIPRRAVFAFFCMRSPRRRGGDARGSDAPLFISKLAPVAEIRRFPCAAVWVLFLPAETFWRKSENLEAEKSFLAVETPFRVRTSAGRELKDSMKRYTPTRRIVSTSTLRRRLSYSSPSPPPVSASPRRCPAFASPSRRSRFCPAPPSPSRRQPSASPRSRRS